jgi:hypothetical protein
MTSRSAVVSGIAGIACAVLYFFVFPGGALSTLMHDVLHLPGPGAGIALILAPILVFGGSFSRLATEWIGAGTICAAAFGLAAMLLRLLGVSMYAAGGFGSALSLLAIVAFGVILDGVFLATRQAKRSWRFALAGGLASLGLLAFYWVAVFPRTTRWVAWRDVPLLAFLALVAGAASGYIAGRGLGSFARAAGPRAKE